MKAMSMGAVLAAAILTNSPTYQHGIFQMPIYRLEHRLKPKAKRDRKNTGSGVAKAKRAKRSAKNRK